MTSLVQQLQQAALDEKVRLGALLRKALVVASKLGVSDFETWARYELDGYGTEIPVPEYRYIRGSPKCFNPYHGWQDIRFGSPKFADKVSTMHMNSGVDSLEDGQMDGGLFIISYNPQAEHDMMTYMTPPMKPALHVSMSAMRGMLGRIRTIVLEWTMKLEKLDVVGKGMTFSTEERAQAASVHIETLIQQVTGSQIQVNSPGARQIQEVSSDQLDKVTALVELITKSLQGADDTNYDVREIRSEAATLRAQVESPRPKRTVLRSALTSLQHVLEGAAGEALAAYLPQALGLVHGLISSMPGN
jgi:hypothetical protein